MQPLLNRRFLPLWITQFLNGMALAPLNSLLVVYADKELHRSPLFAGSLRSLFFLLGGICAIPGGALCDSIGKKRTYLLGLTGSISSTILFMTHDERGLLALSIYSGLAFGLSSTAGQTYMIDSVPRSAVGLATAFFFLGSNLGATAGNLLAAQMLPSFGFFRMAEFLTVGTTLILIGASFALPPSLVSASKRNSVDVARSLIGYGEIFRRRTIQLLVATRYLTTTYWGAHTLLLPYFIYEITGGKLSPESASAAAIYGAASSFAPPFFQLLTGRYCDRIGRRTPALISLVVTMTGSLLIALLSQSLIPLYILGVVVACSAWSLSTTMPGFVNDLSSPQEKGRVLGSTHMAWSIGMLSGSIGGGYFQSFSPAMPFYIGSAMCFVALLCMLTLFAIAPESEGKVVMIADVEAKA